MKFFTVKEIAELLQTNPETVRRWIRNGELHAKQDSRKDGNLIPEYSLNLFLDRNPKYSITRKKQAETADKSVASVPDFSSIFDAIKSMINVYCNTPNPTVKIDDMDGIISKMQNIETKQKEVQRLEKEIQSEKQAILDLMSKIK